MRRPPATPRFVSATLAAGALAFAAGSTAYASTVRECGDLVSSGAGSYNVTTRHVSCHYARRFVRHAPGRCYSGTCRYRHFKCRARQEGYELTDIRCVRGAKVIRWQSGA
jgi:hypothetical protein